MDFENFDVDIIEIESCPICNEQRYKNIVDQLLLKGIAYESIFRYLVEKHGVRIPVSEIKYHKENHFKLREEKAFKAIEQQEETRELFEKYRLNQQKSIDLINTLNLLIEQCIKRIEPLMVDNKGLVNDKTIIQYMEQIRKTSESLAKLKGDLTEGNVLNIHLIKNENEKLVEVVASVLDELAPELKDQFYLRLTEKLEEAIDEKDQD